MRSDQKVSVALVATVALLVLLWLSLVWYQQKPRTTLSSPQPTVAAVPNVQNMQPSLPTYPSVDVTPVRAQDYQHVIIVKGTTAVGGTVDVVAPTTGTMTGYKVAAGDKILAGDVIASMTGSPLPPESPLQKNVRVATPGYGALASDTTTENITSTVPRAVAPLENIELFAPANGTMLTPLETPGHLLSAQQPVARIRLDDASVALGLVNGATVKRTQVGQNVTFQMDNGQIIDGTLAHIGPYGSQHDAYQLVVTLERADSTSLQPNQAGRIVIPAEITQAFKVPANWLVPLPDKRMALMVVTTSETTVNNTPQRVFTVKHMPVSLLAASGKDMWLTGLPLSGAMVISSWQHPLREGQPITPNNTAAKIPE